MKNYKSFELLKKMYFVRTSGTEQELRCANLLKDEALKVGADEAHLEEFDVFGYTIQKASIVFEDPAMTFECTGVGMSGSTPEQGVRGEFAYVTSLEDAMIQDLEGKICLVHSNIVRQNIYKALVEKKAAGLIVCTGSVYKSNKDVDLDPYAYRERHLQVGKIPAVCIRMRDAEKLLRKMPKIATLTVVQDEYTNKSHNVVATIEGKGNSDEVVCFSAHYDSVPFSRGIYDNATGSTSIMQLLAHFVAHRPERTLKFIWCGSEEVGLLGSKAYVEAHKEELGNYRLNINVDMIGVTIGTDTACSTAEKSLVDYIKYMGKMEGFAISSRQGVYSSDSTPFADNGVPAVTFARMSPRGGATIHSHDDIIDWLSEDNYYKTCQFMAKFAQNMVNCVCFPVEKSIPDNMKTELDYYNGRKERPE